ncbi:winged helix-turn-helix domain-containing protein [Natrinema versiforme]|uniref:Transcriptional regulator n=1 Tax=Natrinema versiforme JCM 10478 TaxID=1227496 RepID=L9YBE7_9EURY|nr:helix-turn-helix domain-containing protein [Natrinema versiforme]ELY71385.1 transcriptional regulator [Natrinema versiforme JCM 10478]
MAIPTWLWTATDGPAGRSRSRIERDEDNGDGDGLDLEAVSNDLELLSSPVRLEILLTLADRDHPIRYGELREAVSIEDNGQLNYHLRRLESAVTGDDGEYALTARGERLLKRATGPT